MSIVYQCDACGKTSKKGLNVFSYLCHMEDIANGNLGHGYVDSDFEIVSGRSVSSHLCNKCYNVVVIESVRKLYEIQKDNMGE